MRRFAQTLGLCALALAAASASAYAQGLQTQQDDASQTANEAFPVRVLGGVNLSTAVVVDDDPANDTQLDYFARTTYAINKQFSVYIQAAVSQAFTLQDEPTCGDLRVADPASCRGAGDDAKPSEREFQVTRNTLLELSDVALAGQARTPIKLTDELAVGVLHDLALFVPTSWTAQHRDMILAARYRVRLMLPPLVEGLSVLLLPRFSYRFHQFAETIGAGAPITQLDAGARLAADYTLMTHPRFGWLGVGGSMGTQYLRRYDVCSDGKVEGSLEGACGYAVDPTRWQQLWDWEAHVNYSPLGWLSVGLAVQHGEPVVRNGVQNIDFLDRNRTRMALTVLGTY